MVLGFCLLLNKKKNVSFKLESPSISVIVSVRNEGDRIAPLLKSFDSIQTNINNVELIFIDDHSTDDSFEILNSWASKSKITTKVIALNKDEIGKKNAIIQGLKLSKSVYILCMDADVSFNSDFLEIISSSLQTSKDFYFIPVVEYPNGNVFSNIESFILSLVTMGSARLNFPLLANGAAMLFKKSSFDNLQPFQNNQHVSSGDDVFLLQNFKNNNMSFEFISPNEAFVSTESPKLYKHYLTRALRWSGKMKFSNLYFTKLVGLLVLLSNYIVLGMIITFLFSPSAVLLLLILGKFFIDFLGLIVTVSIYGNFRLLVYSPLMLLFYPFHLLILFALSIFNLQTSWKGRPIEK
jgi:poly-beta-1,6-N-acetyl-D-glucosamine synthase